MKNVHLVISDLLLPKDFAAEVYRGLRLPALEKMLARGTSTDEDRSTAPARGTPPGAHPAGGLGAGSHPSTAPARGTPVGSSPLRGDPTAGSGRTEGISLEEVLCGLFGVPCQPDAPIAPVSAAFDGLGGGCDTLLAKPADCGSSRQTALPTLESFASPCQGGCCWLRADPVHLRLQRDQLMLLPDVGVSADEAGQLCAALNEHFAGQGMEFFAPHVQRWYVRVDRLPDIETVPLSQAAGRNVRGLLPKGREAAHWHRVFNEIQMLLFAHPVNEAREARGELPINSLWLWGSGCTTNALPQRNYDYVSSDEELAGMFAVTAGISFIEWPEQWHDEENGGRQLLVWTGLHSALQRGDPEAWRAALQEFEINFAQPLWQALRAGRIARLQLDILGGNRTRRLLLTRADAWAFWRRTRSLAQYVMV